MPAWRAIASAVRRLSPVSIATSKPAPAARATAAAPGSLSGSATPSTAREPAVDGDVDRRARASGARQRHPAAAGVDADLLHVARRLRPARGARRPSRVDAVARLGLERLRARHVDAALAFAPPTSAWAIGCSLWSSRAATSASSSSSRRCRQRLDVGQLRAALGQRSGLVEHHRVQARHRLERRALSEEDAQLCGLARAHHDRGRRGQTHGARTGDDQHADRRHEGVAQRRAVRPAATPRT